jgi:hypothetical protein
MSSRSFSIFCSQCSGFILTYRKEGSGSLIRIYVKQILEPIFFKQFKNSKLKSEISPLQCSQCKQKLGIPKIHKPGNRPAYEMIKGKFFKKEL